MEVTDQKPCGCKSGLECDFSCIGEDEIIKARCSHPDTSIVVLQIVANCEKTATQCDYCGKILTEPTTDCR
jgi:hypothetical protein